MTPFFQVSPGSVVAMYRCSSSSVPTSMALVMGLPGCNSTRSVPSSAQAEAILVFALFHCYFGEAKSIWPICPVAHKLKEQCPCGKVLQGPIFSYSSLT